MSQSHHIAVSLVTASNDAQLNRQGATSVAVALAQTQSSRHLEDVIDALRLASQSLSAFDVDLDGRLFVASASRASVAAAQAAVAKALGLNDVAHAGATSVRVTASANDAQTNVSRIHVTAVELSADGVRLGVLPLGTDRILRSALFIGGRWVSPARNGLLPVVNPATKSTFHHVANATVEDVDSAVKAAQAGFGVWRAMSASERSRLLIALADAVLERKRQFTELEVLDTGKPWKEADMDMNDTADCFKYYAKMIVDRESELNGSSIDVGNPSFTCEVVKEPVGVCGLIVPWNYPLLMATWKLAPCLASGCTAVLKPSELTPLTALELAALTTRLGFPAGVLNVLTGYGPDAGAPLVEHPGVRKVAFTGSVATGARVAQAASKGIKKFTLELGGKSALIVHKDADVDAVVDWASFGIFWNAGQNCTATSRLLIHEDIFEPVIKKLSEVAKGIKVGGGFDRSSTLGPLINETQFRKVSGYIRSGLDEGAHAAFGGVPKDDAEGFFVAPTVLVDVKPSMKVWREEIFGPVLSVMRFSDIDEALRLANDTEYGLGAAVMTADPKLGKRIAKSLEAGVVWVNCSQPTFCTVPFGGYKQSGIGRELGTMGLDAYLETKQISTWVDEKTTGWGWFL